jgi:hypothetical protein
MDGIGSDESVRLCVNPCPLWDNNHCSLWNNVLCGHILLNLGYWVVSACNFNLVNRRLIINELSICAILHSALLQLYAYYYGMYIVYFPHLLSTNHKCIQPC